MSIIRTQVGVVAVATIPANNVGPFYTAPDGTWMRVVVRNLGGSVLYLAFVSSALNGLQVTSDRYELPAGLSDVFILVPRQSFFAVANGANTRLCYTASVALPVQLQGA